MDPVEALLVLVRVVVAVVVGNLVFAIICGSEKSSVAKRKGTVRKGLMAAVPVGFLILTLLFYPLQVCGGLLLLFIVSVVLLRVRAPAPMEYPKGVDE